MKEHIRDTLIEMLGLTLALEELLPAEEDASIRVIRKQLDQLLGRMEKRWEDDRDTD